MPKQKTNKAAAKRFKMTASGLIKRGKQNRRHILTKKSTKRKRHLRGSSYVSGVESAKIKTLIQG